VISDRARPRWRKEYGGLKLDRKSAWRREPTNAAGRPALLPISEIASNSPHSGGELATLIAPVWRSLICVAGMAN